MRHVVVLLGVVFSRAAVAGEPILPGPALDLPVDLDGDGQSTFGDLYTFNWWLENGGDLAEALKSAQLRGSVLDLKDFFSGASARLVPLGGGSPAGAGPLGPGGGTCIPPPDQPNHTRRIPPTVEPAGIDPLSMDARTTPDSRFIVFSSRATNLAGSNGFFQVYRFEQGTSSSSGTVLHISKQQDGATAKADCLMPSISNDGTRVVFHTAAKLVPGDTDSVRDVYLLNLTNPQSPVATRLTPPLLAGIRGDSIAAAISGNGQFAAFTTSASDLFGDQNGVIADVCRVNIATGLVEPASVDNAGMQSMTPFSTIGDDPALCPASVLDLRVGRVISDNGSRVLMHGKPCDWGEDGPFRLCPTFTCEGCLPDCSNCPNATQQVYLRDFAQAGLKTFLVSRLGLFDVGLGECDGFFAGDACSRRASISGDGSRVAFSSFARRFRNIGIDPDTFEDVFFIRVADVINITNCVQPTRVSVVRCDPFTPDGDSFQPMLSTNGTRIAFASNSTRLLPGAPCPDTNGRRDIFIRNTGGATTARFSISSAGVPGNGDSKNPDISGDGLIALYESAATNLLGPGGDMNNRQDIFQSPSPQGPFIRGDVDLNAVVDISDAIQILNWLFQGGPVPACHDSADADDDGTISPTDPTVITNYLFLGGPQPPCPFCCSAAASCCGKDPTGDGLPCGQTLPGCTQFTFQGVCP